MAQFSYNVDPRLTTYYKISKILKNWTFRSCIQEDLIVQCILNFKIFCSWLPCQPLRWSRLQCWSGGWPHHFTPRRTVTFTCLQTWRFWGHHDVAVAWWTLTWKWDLIQYWENKIQILLHYMQLGFNFFWSIQQKCAFWSIQLPHVCQILGVKCSYLNILCFCTQSNSWNSTIS